VIHGGNDICSWLHKHQDIAEVFPQLLSHRNLAALVKRSLDDGKPAAAVKTLKREPSALLKEKKNLAHAAFRKRDVDSAMRLWGDVLKQAEKEENGIEALSARLETVLVLAHDDRLDDALTLADTCLRDVNSVDLGEDRWTTLQLIGEVHRIKGNVDQARGFTTKALEHARSVGSKLNEGFALLSLSALERIPGEYGGGAKWRELIDLAYNAFSVQYATTDAEKRKEAIPGFAQCHYLRAESFGAARADEALAEWTRALEFFRGAGEDYQWELADTLLARADLRGRIGEYEQAAADLDGAAKIFQQLPDVIGLSRC
jgi:ATP/maltotriose-dependent transcriptional regulator MalT